MAGRPQAAEVPLRRASEEAEQTGDIVPAATAAALLIEALLEQGRLDDAEKLLPRVRAGAVGDAVVAHVRRRRSEALVLAAREDPAAAEELAREGVELAAATDDLNLQGVALLTLAEVARDATAAEEAAERFDRKGNVVSAAAARAMHARLTGLT